MNTSTDVVFKADPGIPSPENMALALFPPNGLVTTPLQEVVDRNILYALPDIIVSRFRDIYRLDAIVHSGLHTTWKDLNNNRKRDINGQHIPHEIVYQTSRSWYVICGGCKTRGKFFILAECFFRKSKNGTKHVEVKKVFFHDSVCHDCSLKRYPNSCCLTDFPFNEIIGTTYNEAASILSKIDITKSAEASPYPKQGFHIDGGNEKYLIDNRQYLSLPEPELGVDKVSHNHAIWRLLYYHVSIHNISSELASPTPFFVFNSIEERPKKHGHLTVDQVTCIYGQQDLRYNWLEDPPPNDSYPDPEDGGEVCQVPHVDCPTGESRELREIMFQHGRDIRHMPGTIIVPLHEDGRDVYGQSPKLNLVKIPKGSYLSFDGDWVHGGVSRKPPNKEMCPALHIHIDSYYMGRRKDRLDLDTRDVDRAIYLPKEHLPFRNLVSLMRVLQKRSKELLETISPVRDRFHDLECKQQNKQLLSPNMDPDNLSPNDIDTDVDSEDDESYDKNRRKLRSIMYQVYSQQINVLDDIASMIADNGKPSQDNAETTIGIDLRRMQLLFTRASKASKAATKASNAMSRRNGCTPPTIQKRANHSQATTPHDTDSSIHETAESMVMLHGAGRLSSDPIIASTNRTTNTTPTRPKRKCASKKSTDNNKANPTPPQKKTKNRKFDCQTAGHFPINPDQEIDDNLPNEHDNMLHEEDPTML